MAYLGHRGAGHRRIRRRGGRRYRSRGPGIVIGSMKVIAIILLLVSLVPIGIGAFLTWRRVETKKYFVETKAVITEIDWWTEGDYDVDGYYTERLEYAVYVDYEIDGTKYNDVPLDFYHAGMREGDTITILYDSRNPYNIASKGGSTAGIWIAYGIGAIFIVAGCIQLARYLKEKNQLSGSDE